VPSGNKRWDVFEEDHGGSHGFHNSEEVRPDEPLVLLASPLASDRERLAGQPSDNEVNHSRHIRCREAGEIRPNWSCWKRSVFKPRNQDFGCADFPLNVSDWAHISESEV
jgi:hypothetical protein